MIFDFFISAFLVAAPYFLLSGVILGPATFRAQSQSSVSEPKGCQKNEMAGHRIQTTAFSCSDVKMEGVEKGEGIRLIESLRGRLLAEREASRAAREEAELICKRLVELDSKLREETKLRDKARKRLEFLEKKLTRFRALPLSESSGKSFDSCSDTCRSSSTPSSEVKQQTALHSTHGHLPDAAEKLGLKKYDLQSEDTSSSSSITAAAVHPEEAATDMNEQKKFNRNVSILPLKKSKSKSKIKTKAVVLWN
ncbi:hypothetical protein SAY86_007612 [Trapa natans]|uniref:Uncharacterized protein n=1 Tax=Trapa natans TaxID=22666 RepID=A0AAN7L8M3_TRANT|nr:hypothetical protein SAY86_007612 [Trapa natans]